MRGKKAILIRHGVYVLIIAVYAALTHFFEIHCPIAYVLGFPCPTCGMTRAIVSLFTLDLTGYVTHNPFALPMLVSVLALIHLKLFKKKTPIMIASLSVVALNFVFWLWRLF